MSCTAQALLPVTACKIAGAACARAALLAADEDHSGTDSPTHDSDLESMMTMRDARDHLGDRAASHYGFGYESSVSTSTSSPCPPLSHCRLPARAAHPYSHLCPRCFAASPPGRVISCDTFDPTDIQASLHARSPVPTNRAQLHHCAARGLPGAYLR